MEPAVIAALINAFTNIGTRVFEKWSPSWFESTRQQDRLRSTVEEKYDLFREGVHNNSVRVLKSLENGQNRADIELIRVIHPNFDRLRSSYSKIDDGDTDTVAEKMLHEFKFRLKYLESLGLVKDAGEYFITPIGMEFLRLARERRDYYDVLFR